MKRLVAMAVLLTILVCPAFSRAEEHPARRFEIVFCVSLPLTVFHSFLIVGGIEWLKEGSSVKLEEKDWLAIGASALALSSIIAYYDLKKQPSSSPNSEFSNYSAPKTLNHPFKLALAASANWEKTFLSVTAK
ncbi:MAG: hypothetical protein AB1797_05995 [bacterium]